MNDEKKDDRVEESESKGSSASKPENEETEKEIEAEEKAEEEAVEEAAGSETESETEKNETSATTEEKEDNTEKNKLEESQTQTPTQTKKVSGKLKDLIEDIEKLSVLELADLVKALEDKFGVTPAAPVAVAGPGARAASDAGEEDTAEEQTTFNVILAESGANKIGVIKAVREVVPTLGLKEAKDLVEAAPKPVLEGVGKDAANEAKGKLEAAGAKVELQ